MKDNLVRFKGKVGRTKAFGEFLSGAQDYKDEGAGKRTKEMSKAQSPMSKVCLSNLSFRRPVTQSLTFAVYFTDGRRKRRSSRH